MPKFAGWPLGDPHVSQPRSPWPECQPQDCHFRFYRDSGHCWGTWICVGWCGVSDLQPKEGTIATTLPSRPRCPQNDNHLQTTSCNKRMRGRPKWGHRGRFSPRILASSSWQGHLFSSAVLNPDIICGSWLLPSIGCKSFFFVGTVSTYARMKCARARIFNASFYYRIQKSDASILL